MIERKSGMQSVTDIPLADGKIIVGDASNLGSPVTPSGDATISNTGVVTVAATHSGSAHHTAVTLDTNADTLLSLSTQTLGIDTQTANTSLMGPVSGAAAVPTFRSPQAKDVVIPGGIGTPTYDDMQDWLRMTRSSGRLTGGVLSAYVVPGVPDGKVLVSAMEGMIFTTNALGGDYIYFKYAGCTIDTTGFAGDAVGWVFFDWNGGTPQCSVTTTYASIHEYDQFVLGRIYYKTTTVEVQSTGMTLYDLNRRAHNRLILKYGNMDHVSGAVISAHATPLRLSCTAGSWYSANTSDTTGAATTFFVWYKTGGGAWTKSSERTLFSEVFDGGTSTVYETYQNGTSLGALTANFYGVYWVFICPEGNLYVLLGDNKYSNIGLAQAASVPTSLPPYLVDWGVLIGKVICKNAAAALFSVESSFTTKFTLSAATDHSSLANLTADDHTQYLLVAGTRALTGDIDFAGAYQCHDLQLPAAAGEAIRQTAKITETNLENAVDLKHAAVTVSAPISISTQALSLVNDAAGTITEIDTAALADSDTVIPTSKRAKDYADTKVSNASNLTDNAVVRGDGGARGVQTSTMLIDDSGRMTNPSQPSFLAYCSGAESNVTGDGTYYNPTMDTEVFDQGNNFASHVFTAAIAGKHSFTFSIFLQQLAAANTINVYLNTSNRSYGLSCPYLGTDQAFTFAVSDTDMDLNDTTFAQVMVSGATKIIDILGAASMYTWISGHLVC
jgi:hypothetical protein